MFLFVSALFLPPLDVLQVLEERVRVAGAFLVYHLGQNLPAALVLLRIPWISQGEIRNKYITSDHFVFVNLTALAD